jgi:hypothetical protein
MARRPEVTIGQRYQPVGSSAMWEVVDIVRDGAGIPHARLTAVGNPTAAKTLAVSALRDARLYRVVLAPTEDK